MIVLKKDITQFRLDYVYVVCTYIASTITDKYLINVC